MTCYLRYSQDVIFSFLFYVSYNNETMVERRKLNGVWDVNRILREYIHFADKCGRIKKIDMSDDSPYGIKLRRFVAAMKAYGRECDDLNDIEGIISNSCSSDKLDEFRQLLKPLLDNDYHKEQIYDARFIRGSHDRYYLFEALFEYRKCLYEVENVWSGLIECPMSVSMVCNATKYLYTKHIKGISDTIDRMLVLLMGDDFDRSFTEEELLPFGYPDVTDEEMESMILDNF